MPRGCSRVKFFLYSYPIYYLLNKKFRYLYHICYIFDIYENIYFTAIIYYSIIYIYIYIYNTNIYLMIGL